MKTKIYVGKKEYNVELDESDPERTELANANHTSMIKLMEQYNFLIPARSFPLWRPTKRESGSIDGIRNGLEIIATDGILAWFITPEGDAWCGHIHHFNGKIEPLHSFHGPMASKTKIKKQKSRRREILDSL